MQMPEKNKKQDFVPGSFPGLDDQGFPKGNKEKYKKLDEGDIFPNHFREEGPVDKEDGKNEDDGGDELNFPDDVYSLIYVASWASCPFWFSLFVYGFQMAILWLCFLDLIDDGHDQDKNILNVAPTASMPVWVGQAMALCVAVLSQDDVTSTLLLISIRLQSNWDDFQQELQAKFQGGARTWQFWLAKFLRLSEGLTVILIGFLFIVQSENVLDIFMNLAAIEFVSELDNIAYRLAQEGWFDTSTKTIAIKIAGIALPAKKSEKSCWINYVNRFILVVILAGLYSGWAVVYDRQADGHYIQLDACSVLDVKFGDEVYPFPEGTKLNFTEDIYDTKMILDSNRTLLSRFDPDHPPDLHYAYFSGKYHADFNNSANTDIDNERPVYYESHDLDPDDSVLGIFYYCENENAWVWSVRAFAFEGVAVVPKETKDRCKYGWLLRSPKTEALTLEEAPSNGWRIWTGVMTTAKDFSFLCVECDSNLDCGGARGACQDGRCNCEELFEGDFCEHEKSCDHLALIDPRNGLPYTLRPGVDATGLDFSNMATEEKTWLLTELYISDPETRAYGRPMFWGMQYDDQEIRSVEMIIFSGRRWYNFLFTSEDFWRLTAEEWHTLPHPYWDNFNVEDLRWYSETTDKFLPTGPLKWYGTVDGMSVGSYGPFGKPIEYDFRFECLSVSCDASRRICGAGGTCEENQTLLEFADEEKIVGGKCNCRPGYTGHFCDFVAPTQPPTRMPTLDPTWMPTFEPTQKATPDSTSPPTPNPTPLGTKMPTNLPSNRPSDTIVLDGNYTVVAFVAKEQP